MTDTPTPAPPLTDEQIETVEALMALPVGTVVRSDMGTIGCRITPTDGVCFGDERTFPWSDLAVPVTVLWPVDRAAVIARAKREERERVVTTMRGWAAEARRVGYIVGTAGPLDEAAARIEATNVDL